MRPGWFRCKEPGMEQIACPDGRRGLWMRRAEKDGALIAVELVSGREGDDHAVMLTVGQTVDAATLHELIAVLDDLRFAADVCAPSVNSTDIPK